MADDREGLVAGTVATTRKEFQKAVAIQVIAWLLGSGGVLASLRLLMGKLLEDPFWDGVSRGALATFLLLFLALLLLALYWRRKALAEEAVNTADPMSVQQLKEIHHPCHVAAFHAERFLHRIYDRIDSEENRRRMGEREPTTDRDRLALLVKSYVLDALHEALDLWVEAMIAAKGKKAFTLEEFTKFKAIARNALDKYETALDWIFRIDGTAVVTLNQDYPALYAGLDECVKELRRAQVNADLADIVRLSGLGRFLVFEPRPPSPPS